MTAIVDGTTKVYIASQGQPLCVLPASGGVPIGRSITAGTGLTGGGDLSQDRILALDAASIASLAKADTATQPGDNVSSLTNDAGYVDAAGASAAAPVQSVDGKTGAVDLSGDYDALGAAAAAQAFAIQRINHTGTQAASTVQIAENSVIIGNSSNLGSALPTGTKGRALLALATDAALQTEIIARIAGATIAPAVVQATGKISTSSTAADSIATSGSADIGERIIARSSSQAAVQSLGGFRGLAVVNDTGGTLNNLAFAHHIYFNANTTLTGVDSAAASGAMLFISAAPGRTVTLKHGSPDSISSNVFSLPGAVDLVLNEREGASFVVNAGAWRLVGRTYGPNISALTFASTGGTLPTGITATQVGIGAGRVDAGERVVARSTAANAIESLGGVSAVSATLNRLNETFPGSSPSTEVNNLDTSGRGGAYWFGTGTTVLTGIVPPADYVSGATAPFEVRTNRFTLLTGVNRTITIKHDDALSTDVNRIRTPDGNDFTVSPGTSCTLIYTPANGGRWVVVA